MTTTANGMILNETNTTVSIITGLVSASSNKKTGDMAQIWILNKDIDPVTALKNGDSKEICFDCPHLTNGTCYVNVGQAPAQIYKAYKAGKYSPLDFGVLKALIKWKAVRFGAYGEPVLIPLDIVKFIADNCRGYTGYTHQWRNAKYSGYKKYLMASADCSEDVQQAHIADFRTFRVKGENDANLTNEIDCPNQSTGIQCRDCTLCDGLGKHKNGKSITVKVHGTVAKVNKFNRLLTPVNL